MTATMPFEQYQAIDAVNWSSLKHMRQSPLHYRHARATPRTDMDAFRKGRAIHTLVLEPERWHKDYCVWDGGRRAGKKWDAFCAQLNGRTQLSMAEADAAHAAAQAVLSHPVARRHLQHGAREQTIQWTDEATGLLCKARLDFVNGHLVDLKSAADVDPLRFAASCVRLGYTGQYAHYEAGLKSLGYELHQPAMIVVESGAPHEVLVYDVNNAFLEHGRLLRRKLLDRLAECIEADHWPGRCTDAELPLILPAWAEAELEDMTPPITMGGVALGL